MKQPSLSTSLRPRPLADAALQQASKPNTVSVTSPLTVDQQQHLDQTHPRASATGRSIMPFTIEKASLTDAKAIADIYQDRPVTAWNRLTHGTVDPSVFNAGLEDMFAESLRDPDEVLFLARDEDHPERKVVSYVNLAARPALVPMTDEVRACTCDRPGKARAEQSRLLDIGSED